MAKTVYGFWVWWGAGDQGTVTLDCAVAMKRYRNIDFLDFKEKGHREISDHLIYRENDVMVSEFLQSYDEVIVASGDNDLRETKLSFLILMGIPLATIILGKKSFLGIGCTIIDNIEVGQEAVIGAGAVVIRNVSDHAVVAGVPAKLI